jgi:hypothetical protein
LTIILTTVFPGDNTLFRRVLCLTEFSTIQNDPYFCLASNLVD